MHSRNALARSSGCYTVALIVLLAGRASGGILDQIDCAAAQAEGRNISAAEPAAPHHSVFVADAAPAPRTGPVSLRAHVDRDASPPTGQFRFARVTLETQPAAETALDAPPGVRPEAPPVEQRPEFTFSLKRDLRNWPGSLWEDTKRVYAKPLPVTLLLLAGGSAVALRPEVDDEFEDHFDRERHIRGDWGEVAGVLGNPGTHLAIAAGWYFVGLKAEDPKTYSAGKALLNALIITDLSTLAVKLAAHTEAPNGEDWAFPSGHASSSFALAAVMDQYYGPLVGWPLYGLAGWISYMRMEDREHHFSDIIFGGAMGLIIGHAVAGGHMPEIAGGVIMPYADPVTGSAGVAWVKQMK